MRRTFITVLGLMCLSAYAQINLDWVKTMGGLNSQKTNAHVIDQDKNIYMVGYFFGTVDFDPSINTYSLTSNGYQDIFIQKLDSLGNLVWVESIGSPSSDIGYAITLDNYNNIVITGQIPGFTPIDLDPGTGTFMVNTGGSDHHNYFVLKLDNNGNFVWAKTVGDPSGATTYWDEKGSTIAVDNNNDIIIGGTFGGVQDFDPGVGIYNLTSTNSGGDRNMFLHKLDENGDFIWAKSFGNSGMLGMEKILVDGNGNIYTTGYYMNTIDFDPSASTVNLTSNGSFDTYIQKINPNGSLLWARSLGNANWDSPGDISFDHSGNLLLAGKFYGTVDFDPGTGVVNKTSNSNNNNMYVLKLDANGSFLWVQHIGGTGYVRPHVINCDNQGNIYLAGDFYDTANFATGIGTQNLTSVEGAMFLLKLNNTGNFIHVDGLFPPGDYGYMSFSSMSITNNNQIILSGGFSDTVNINPSGINNIISNGDDDIFVVRYNQDNGAVGIEKTFSLLNDRILQKNNVVEIKDYSNEIVEVVNLNGQIVKRIKSNSVSLDLYSKGMYIVNLYSNYNELLSIKKVVVE